MFVVNMKARRSAHKRKKFDAKPKVFGEKFVDDLTDF